MGTTFIHVETFNEKEACEVLAPAIEVLKSNGTVVIPTETVYGLAANALSEVAIAKIYAAKGRPSDNPLIVHISNETMLKLLVSDITETAIKLMDAFWPGPLTLIFKKKDIVPNCTTGGLDTVAVRLPSHPVARMLIECSNMPIAAPSANLSGKPSPTTAAHVKRDLMGRVDCMILGDSSEVGLESTVVDVTSDIPMILRPGAITREMILEVVGSCQTDPAIGQVDTMLAPKSPGMKYKHYAPEAEVTVLMGDTMAIIKIMVSLIETQKKTEEKIGLLLFEEDYEVLMRYLASLCGDAFEEASLKNVFFCKQGSKRDLSIFAKQLFNDLRACDDMNCQKVYVHGVLEEGIGSAIMNRLKKAAENRMLYV